MKKITLILLSVSLLLSPLSAQKGIIINSGAVLKMEGNVYLKISGDHNFVNHSTQSQFGGTVVFAGSAPQLITGDQASEFAILDINNAYGVNLGNAVSVNQELMLNAGILDISDYNITIGENADITGSFSSDNFIAADGEGYVIRQIGTNGLYLFPMGDRTSGNDYSPAELDFISGTYNNGAVSMRVRNIKHENNSSASNYLNRYWTVQSSGISAIDADVDFSYVPTDISGNEANIYGGRWNGTSWFQLNPVSSGHITANITDFGDFTGADASIFTDVEDLLSNTLDVTYSDGNLFIQNSGENTYSKMHIFSASGQLVYSSKVGYSNLIRVPFSPAKGMYIIELVSENQKVHKKFMVN
jgi:hypothetical protein